MIARVKIAFFSRGRGRGHVVPDMAIVRELESETPGVDVRFVSYGIGSATLRQRGFDVIDLAVADNSTIIESVVSAAQVVGSIRPELVIAHEEFGALPAAKIFNLPSLFITDFFQDPNALTTRCLRYADEVVFIGNPGEFTEPPFLKNKVQYVGAAVRRFEYRKCDRVRARTELGLPVDGTVISFMPGSWREAQAPVADLVVGAFDRLPFTRKCLVWLTGPDYEVLRHRCGSRDDIILKKEDWQIDRLMVASDLAITRGTRTTLRELSALGIPSISLSHGLNWPDDVVASRIPSNTFLNAVETNCEALCNWIQKTLADAGPEAKESEWPAGIQGAVARLADHVERIRGQAGGSTGEPKLDRG
ncbi:MAG: hypothetical protein ACRD2G_13045 [Terriglobia bacterium]